MPKLKLLVPGFTLIEIMIALMIFAIMATIVSTGLYSVLKTRDVSDSNARQMQRYQLAMALMRQDFSFAINRPITNASGQTEPAVVSDGSSISVTHSGNINPGMQFPRSNLQRIRYELVNNQLIRRNWRQLDPNKDRPPNERVLLDNVEQLQFIFLTAAHQTKNSWILSDGAIPNAIEVLITLKNQGIVNRVFTTQS